MSKPQRGPVRDAQAWIKLKNQQAFREQAAAQFESGVICMEAEMWGEAEQHFQLMCAALRTLAKSQKERLS